METRTDKENMPAASAHSPAKGYISHVPVSQPLPPPPYALHPNSQPVSGGYPISGLISPPASHSTESRRTSDDPNDYQQQHPRQSLPSLPSISEALHYPARTAPSHPAPPNPLQQPAHAYGNPSGFAQPPPPPPPMTRSYAGHDERSAYPPAASHSHYMRRSPPPAIHPVPAYAGGSQYASAVVDRHQSLPSLRTALPSQAAPYSPHHHPEPTRYEVDSRRMEPPREEPPRDTRPYNDPYYGYPTAATNGYSAPYPSRPRSPAYQNSAPYHRAEPPRPYGREDIGRPMGLKRDFEHGEPEGSMMFQRTLEEKLQNNDFEMALAELQRCGDEVSRMSAEIIATIRRNQTGPGAQIMPAMRYHDQMLGCQRRLDEAFTNAKHFMVEQQRLAEDHRRLKARDGKADGYGDEEQWPMDKDQSFHGPDAKKIRRGQRAAPPGRCHGCNRSETPEWRRGPDGARTLCNACGLHYAKLTRRMGSKTQGTTGSSLRPKSMEGTSPL